MSRKSIPFVKAATSRRSTITLIAFSLALSVLLFNILRLSIFAYAKYKDKSFDQITTTSPLTAERGSIYDANMNILAATKTVWRVFVSPKAVSEASKNDGNDYVSEISEGLSQIFLMDKEDIKKKISNKNLLDVTVKKAASEDEYRMALAFATEHGLSELIQFEAQASRYYPEEYLAAHVLGFTGSDNQGLYGLEYYYDEMLSGKDGYYLYAKDANGNPMPGKYSSYVAAEDGYSLVTTLDTYIQRELEAQLSTILENHDVTGRVTGIVMDTESGAILAMATSSPFNPNSPYVLDELSEKKLEASGFAPGSDEYKALKTELMQIMWSNKAVSETYEPGSTFKIVTVAAALDSGSAKMHDTFSCHGYHTVGGWRIKCHKTTGHGSSFPLSYGLQMSCNPTMMAIAERMGAETFYSYVEKFGYFEKTDIDLPSEAETIFHDLESMGSTELATASFGQRFKVSIINQLVAIAAIANGGELVQPYVVEKIIDKNGCVISEHEAVTRRRVVSEAVAKEIASVLEEGVSGEGGAKNAYVEGYAVAAKTGTSQKFDILDENGNSYLRIGSTVAFAPSDNSGVAVIIVVDEPQTSVKYGSTVAAPYVSALLSKVLPYLEYESTSTPSYYTVGDYSGMNINSVKKELSDSGIQYEVVGNGSVVLEQLPAPGMEITASLSKIYLYTDVRDQSYTNVPSLVGMSAVDANKLATNCGLNIKITGVTDINADCLNVTAQSIEAGVRVARGTVIEIKLQRTDFED